MNEKSLIKILMVSLKNNVYFNHINVSQGWYPDNFNAVSIQKLPFILYKHSDVLIQPQGKALYYYNYSPEIIIYYSKLDNWDLLQTEIIQQIYKTLSGIPCLIDIGQINIETGDIGEFMLPSSVGYNANVLVRKITFNYTVSRILTPYEIPQQLIDQTLIEQQQEKEIKE